MKLPYKTLIILFLIPALAMANSEKGNGKYTKEKTVKKEYTVNSNAELKIDNSYGNLDVITWHENRTVIEVHIKTNSDSEEKAQERLDDISVEFFANASLVSAKTLFNKNKKSWSFWGSNNNNVNIEVNYIIKIPVTNSVDLNNDYGAISIDKLEGKAKINCDYGQLRIGELWANDNFLSFDYTSKSTIAYMKRGEIDADYSDFTLEKGESLELSADYTHSEILDIKNINYNCDYGKVVIENAYTIRGQGDYVTNRIGSVSGSLNLDTDYGSIKVERLTGSAKNVTINADYTGVKLGFAGNYNFDFHIDLTYAGFNGEEEVTVTKSSKENSHKIYSGYHGTRNSGNTININSEYGGVTFIKN